MSESELLEQERTANREKAPQCAEFIRGMRQAFGADVKVLHVKEGDFEAGERP